MAKLTLTDITTGYFSAAAYNANNALIETALENTLSRDGTTPNTLSAALDMNSNKINNLTDGTNNQDAVTVKQLNDAVIGSPSTLSIDNLSDVVITTALVNQVLQYNGTNWVNATLSLGANSIDDLSDVDTTTSAPGVGDGLEWNGTNWVPGTPLLTIADNENLLFGTGGNIQARFDSGQNAFEIDWDTGASIANEIRFQEAGSNNVVIDMVNDDFEIYGMDFRVYEVADIDYFNLVHDGTNVVMSESAGSNLLWTGGGNFLVRDGGIFAIYDGTNADNMNMSHDGTNLNITHTGTGAWIITNLATLTASSTDADFDAITATSYGGILEANLLDKAATESVSGAYTFTGGVTFTTGNIVAGTIDADFDALTATSYGGVLEANLQDKTAAETISGNRTYSAADIFMADNTIDQAVLQDYAIESSADDVSGTTVTFTYANGPVFECDMEAATGNVTATLSGGPPTGTHGQITVKMTQDTTVRTLTWAGGTFRWAGGTEHPITTTANGFTIFTFETWDGGTTWYGGGADYS